MSYFMREAEGLQDKKILWESGDRSIIFSFSLSHPITEIPHTFFVHHGFLAVQITNNGVDTEKVKTLKKKKKRLKTAASGNAQQSKAETTHQNRASIAPEVSAALKLKGKIY